MLSEIRDPRLKSFSVAYCPIHSPLPLSNRAPSLSCSSSAAATSCTVTDVHLVKRLAGPLAALSQPGCSPSRGSPLALYTDPDIIGQCTRTSSRSSRRHVSCWYPWDAIPDPYSLALTCQPWLAVHFALRCRVSRPQDQAENQERPPAPPSKL